jgi:hypothetical protein
VYGQSGLNIFISFAIEETASTACYTIKIRKVDCKQYKGRKRTQVRSTSEKSENKQLVEADSKVSLQS